MSITPQSSSNQKTKTKKQLIPHAVQPLPSHIPLGFVVMMEMSVFKTQISFQTSPKEAEAESCISQDLEATRPLWAGRWLKMQIPKLNPRFPNLECVGPESLHSQDFSGNTEAGLESRTSHPDEGTSRTFFTIYECSRTLGL